jgi:hypothetical protein
MQSVCITTYDVRSSAAQARVLDTIFILVGFVLLDL